MNARNLWTATEEFHRRICQAYRRNQTAACRPQRRYKWWWLIWRTDWQALPDCDLLLPEDLTLCSRTWRVLEYEPIKMRRKPSCYHCESKSGSAGFMAEGTRGEQGQRYGKRAKQKLASFTVTALASYFVPRSCALFHSSQTSINWLCRLINSFSFFLRSSKKLSKDSSTSSFLRISSFQKRFLSDWKKKGKCLRFTYTLRWLTPVET